MGRREEQKARRRQAIFAAAIRLFQERGYSATTVEEIAAAADIAKGTFFNYFPTKEAVLLYLNELQVARLWATVRETPGFAQLGSRGQVLALFHALAAGVAGQHELVRLTVGVSVLSWTALEQQQRAIVDNFDRLLAEIVTRGQASGELRADRPAAELAALLRRIYFLTLLEWLEQPETDLPGKLEHNFDLLLEGLGG